MEREAELLSLLGELGDFKKLFRITERVNVFEALGMVRQETKHSRFLGFLLTPSAPHGLGDRFLKALFLGVLANHPQAPISQLQAAISDFGDAIVYFERDNFDISVHVPSVDLLFVIENKVDSAEREKQLSDYRSRAAQRYPGTKFVGAFLTPDGYQGEDSSWCPLSYRTIQAELAVILNSDGAAMSPASALLISHYLDLIERHVVASQDLIDACKKIYAQHRAAIDLVVEHGQTSVLSAAFDSFQVSVPAVQKVANGAGRRVNFVASDWLSLSGFQVADPTYWANPCPVQFWFYLEEQKLYLFVEIGPVTGNTFNRTKFIEEVRKSLKQKDRKITGRYTRVASRKIQVTDDLDAEDVAEKMKKLWRDLDGDRLIQELTAVARSFLLAPEIT